MAQLRLVVHDAPAHCSFCGKSSKEVGKLIDSRRGPMICDACVRLCKKVMDEDFIESSST